ncbi:MAG: histidinol-phosphate transaminase [Clostridia bacterium]|nr:histidinol-phosphate transaminase [Clostridia bacterium]
MQKWKENLRVIEPYVPGEQPQNKDVIKLNTNESPYAPSPETGKAIREYDNDKLRLYPSFVCSELKSALMETYPVNESELFLGNGSDEVLALCFMTFFNSKKPVLFPDITYSFYDVWCNLYNIPYQRIPLDNNFRIIKEDYYGKNGGIVITNPNAPTSVYMELNDIEDIIKHNEDVILIVDEAYIDFGGKSAADLIHKYDNLVVVQTYSKSRNLAGIRVGYAMAQKELIAALEAVKNSFNSYTLNSLSQAAAAASAKDKDYFNECVNKIISTREHTVKELSKLGFETLPSKANFIFTTNKNISAEKLFNYLKEKNIFVRYFNKPRISEYLRITIGTDEQMEALINAIKEFKQ